MPETWPDEVLEENDFNDYDSEEEFVEDETFQWEDNSETEWNPSATDEAARRQEKREREAEEQERRIGRMGAKK